MTEGETRKVSFKAKAIFFLVPFIIIGFIELSSWLYLKKAEMPALEALKAPNTIVFIEKDDVPPKRLDAGGPLTFDEDKLRKNYIKHSKPMLQLPIHMFERSMFYRLRPNSSFSFMQPGGQVVHYLINSKGLRGNRISKGKA